MGDLVDRARKRIEQTRLAKDVVSRELLRELADEIERLREALQSIAKNTCCDRCQEAALVAQAALKEQD